MLKLKIYKIYKTDKINQISNNITFIWIPSHIGIEGDEEADRLAKKALSNPEINITISLEYKDTYTHIDKYILNKWQQQYTHCKEGRFYPDIEPQVSEKI